MGKRACPAQGALQTLAHLKAVPVGVIQWEQRSLQEQGVALQHIVLAQQHLLEGPAAAEVQEGAPACGQEGPLRVAYSRHQANLLIAGQFCAGAELQPRQPV